VLRQNENEKRKWAEFQTPPNATSHGRLCAFLAHTIRSLVWFSMGWKNYGCLFIFFVSWYIYWNVFMVCIFIQLLHSSTLIAWNLRLVSITAVSSLPYPTLCFTGVPTQLLHHFWIFSGDNFHEGAVKKGLCSPIKVVMPWMSEAFAECNILSSSPKSFTVICRWIINICEQVP